MQNYSNDLTVTDYFIFIFYGADNSLLTNAAVISIINSLAAGKYKPPRRR